MYYEEDKQLEINITDCVSDVDSADLTYSIYIGSGTDWTLLISDTSETEFTFSTADLFNGKYDIKLQAKDGQYQTTSIIPVSITIDTNRDRDSLMDILLWIIVILAAIVTIMGFMMYRQSKKPYEIRSRFWDRLLNKYEKIKTKIHRSLATFHSKVQLTIDKIRKKVNRKYSIVNELLDKKLENEDKYDEIIKQKAEKSKEMLPERITEVKKDSHEKKGLEKVSDAKPQKSLHQLKKVPNEVDSNEDDDFNFDHDWN